MTPSTLQSPPQRPLSPQPIRSTAEQGCVWVCLLKRKGWDCHRSLPRYNLHMLRHPRDGYGLLVYRGGHWQLLVEGRKPLILENKDAIH